MIAAASFGWRFYPEFDVMELEIGDKKKIGSLADAVNVLKALFGDRFAELRGLWIRPGVRLEDKFRALLHAESLEKMCSNEFDSTLVRILDERAIETWFQPVFETEELKLWGFECLMRAFDGSELLSPTELINHAEKQNLLFTLDRICRERHIENAARFDVPEG